MKKATKIWLIVAASLVLAGCIIFIGVMSALKWDFTKLSTGKYETNIYEINETFNNISITADTSNITFALSDDGKCKVECYEEKDTTHSVSVENNALVIKSKEHKAWYEYIGFNFISPKITVYLPKTEYNSLSINESTGNVEISNVFSFENADISLTTGNTKFSASASQTIKIKSTTGNIRVENTSADSLDLSVTTGNITVSGANCKNTITVNVSTGNSNLTDISCKDVISSGSTGNINLNNVIAVNKISIKRSTGNVKFNGSDSNEISVKTSTGNVTGSLLTGKKFTTETSTGNINVPDSTSGGTFEIKTSTGNIKITTD